VAVKAVFCSDPKYKELFWDWGDLNLTEGELIAKKIFEIIHTIPTLQIKGQTEGRFSVPVSSSDPSHPDCYFTRLKISDGISSDSRIYYLNVMNQKGHVRQGIELRVSTYTHLS